MSFSKVVFERSTSIGRRLSTFLGSGFAQIFGEIVSLRVTTLRNTNLVVSRSFKIKKASFSVDVRRSETPLLKLPNNT